MENISKGQLTKDLLKIWLDGESSLSFYIKMQLYKIANVYYNSNSRPLYKMYEGLTNGEEQVHDVLNHVSYIKRGSRYNLIYRENSMEFTLKELKRVILSLIDILEEALPLGSVVRLRKEFLSTFYKDGDMGEALVVIVDRFVENIEGLAYFNYSAVIYPLGLLGEKKTINFTSEMIQEVVHNGYSEEKDLIYSYMMKKEFVIHRGIHSLGC